MKTIKVIKKHFLVGFLMLFLISFSSESSSEFHIPSDVISPNTINTIEKRNEDNFTTSLKGSNELPPVIAIAIGEAIVQISKDGNSISYKLIVSDLKNVFAAYFHMAAAGENGPVVAFLFSGEVAIQNGILSEGTITAEDLIGPLEGMRLEELIQRLRIGQIYVNVHTSDVPSGAIRGQL